MVSFLVFVLLPYGFSLNQTTDDMIRQLQVLVVSAKSQEDLQKAERNYSNYKENALICYFELSEQLPPVHCYKVFHRQLREGYLVEEEWSLKKRQLDFHCQENAEKAQSVDLLKSKLQSSNNLSATCLKSIKSRIQDMEYQLEETTHGLMDQISGQTANSEDFGIHK